MGGRRFPIDDVIQLTRPQAQRTPHLPLLLLHAADFNGRQSSRIGPLSHRGNVPSPPPYLPPASTLSRQTTTIDLIIDPTGPHRSLTQQINRYSTTYCIYIHGKVFPLSNASSSP